MNIDNQYEYWDEVAGTKTFTHPIDTDILDRYLAKQSKILDFGCGYGRIVKDLLNQGFNDVTGFDTSKGLISRGKENNLPVFHVEDPLALPVPENSVDCILVFAVFTCIPSNKGQKDLIRHLYSKLKKDGIIYISDYYLQNDTAEVGRYTYLNDDKDNYGVFHLSEGVTFRHHPREWILELTRQFTVVLEKQIEVLTMNGHSAEGFQWVGMK